MPPAATRTALPLDPDRQATLDDILGHGATREFLREAVRSGRLPRSLLLAGPAGVGKKTLAYALAKEIVESGGSDSAPGGAGKIARGTHPDLRVLDGGGTVSGQIVIDTIREMDDWYATSPLESPKKIAIIAPAERMNEAAANALLKVLEEPPPHAVLMLIASDAARLLPTIRSRCMQLALECVGEAELTPWLMRRSDAPRARIELAGRIAEGRPGAALALLKGDALERRADILGELTLLRTHGFAAVFGVADRLMSLGADLDATLGMLLLLLRDLLVAGLGAEPVLNEDLDAELRALAGSLPPEGLLRAANLTESAQAEAAFFYTPAAKLHMMEVLVTGIGRALKGRA